MLFLMRKVTVFFKYLFKIYNNKNILNLGKKNTQQVSKTCWVFLDIKMVYSPYKNFTFAFSKIPFPFLIMI